MAKKKGNERMSFVTHEENAYAQMNTAELLAAIGLSTKKNTKTRSSLEMATDLLSPTGRSPRGDDDNDHPVILHNHPFYSPLSLTIFYRNRQSLIYPS